jgi:hypothetical protein
LWKGHKNAIKDNSHRYENSKHQGIWG